MTRRETVRTVTVTGPITLGDLRWLVDQCAGDADESTVSVQQFRGFGSAEHDPDQITVQGKTAAPKMAQPPPGAAVPNR